MPNPWQTVDTADTPEGPLALLRRGDEAIITVGGRVLMSSAAQRSEQALATLGLAGLTNAERPRVLIGGLGMAITLRAALDVLPASAQVTVVELNPVVQRWCAGPLAGLTAAAAADPRVTHQTADVAQAIRASAPRSWDAILLDLYEGPHRATQRRDDPLYGPAALGHARAALAPGGVMAIWGEEPDPTFPPRFRAAGFDVSLHRPGRGGRAHAVYLGRSAAR